MSSATLTDSARREQGATRPPPTTVAPSVPVAADDSSGLRPWHFFLVASLLLATVTVVVMHGRPQEQLLLAVATIGAAGFAAYSFYRMLSPLVTEGIGEDATMVAGRTRAALERDKMLTLRA